jgi:hypothetical protein
MVQNDARLAAQGMAGDRHPGRWRVVASRRAISQRHGHARQSEVERARGYFYSCVG